MALHNTKKKKMAGEKHWSKKIFLLNTCDIKKNTWFADFKYVNLVKHKYHALGFLFYSMTGQFHPDF